MLWPSQTPDPNQLNTWGLYLLEEWSPSLQESSRVILNQCNGAMRPFRWLVAAQHLIKALYLVFFFNLSPACFCNSIYFAYIVLLCLISTETIIDSCTFLILLDYNFCDLILELYLAVALIIPVANNLG